MENKRGKEIVKVSVIGIVINILLSLSKAIVGFLTNSIAIMMDSLNY
jgi:divalent metal cation (Fe/Co/Zn/Cd) transporter